MNIEIIKKSHPKVIYFCNKIITERDIESANNWKKLNPDYEIKLYDDEMIKTYLLNEYSELHRSIFEYLKDGPIKADFWRICILFKKGGIYSDIDNFPLVKLDYFIEKNVDFVTCSSYWHYNYNPNFIVCCKNNIILKKCIDWYINKYKNGVRYKYWRWSIMGAFTEVLKIDNYTKESGIYTYQNMKIQIIKECSGKNHNDAHNIYKNKRVFNNRQPDWDARPGARCWVAKKELSINKTIYMTYYKNIPEFVKERWLDINKNYNIDFSLDNDCIQFLRKHFNNDISDLFESISKGMYKADLWRLCKLYINSGVYSDVDLVPYLNIDDLDQDITFYSCLSIHGNSIFQALMINFSKPKCPLIFIFLLSFLLNKPITNLKDNGPTKDMFNCLQYMLGNIKIQTETKYNIDELKIKIKVGSSKNNYKVIKLHYFPEDIEYNIKLCRNPYNDKFDFQIENNNLLITRTDQNTGWNHIHHIDICFPYKASFFLFPEHMGKNRRWQDSYVTLNNNKICDSRYIEYSNNGGKW